MVVGLFQKLDVDENGSVSFQELYDAMQDVDTHDIIRLMAGQQVLHPQEPDAPDTSRPITLTDIEYQIAIRRFVG